MLQSTSLSSTIEIGSTTSSVGSGSQGSTTLFDFFKPRNMVQSLGLSTPSPKLTRSRSRANRCNNSAVANNIQRVRRDCVKMINGDGLQRRNDDVIGIKIENNGSNSRLRQQVVNNRALAPGFGKTYKTSISVDDNKSMERAPVVEKQEKAETKKKRNSRGVGCVASPVQLGDSSSSDESSFKMNSLKRKASISVDDDKSTEKVAVVVEQQVAKTTKKPNSLDLRSVASPIELVDSSSSDESPFKVMNLKRKASISVDNDEIAGKVVAIVKQQQAKTKKKPKSLGLGSVSSPIELVDSSSSDEGSLKMKRLNMPSHCDDKSVEGPNFEAIVSEISNDSSNSLCRDGPVKKKGKRQSLLEASLHTRRCIKENTIKSRKSLRSDSKHSSNLVIKKEIQNTVNVEANAYCKKEDNIGEELEVKSCNNKDISAIMNVANSNIENALIGFGSMVKVSPRTWPGINKPGGIARVIRCHYQNNDKNTGTTTPKLTHVDVRYVVFRQKDFNVPIEFCTPAPQYDEDHFEGNGASKRRLTRRRKIFTRNAETSPSLAGVQGNSDEMSIDIASSSGPSLSSRKITFEKRFPHSQTTPSPSIEKVESQKTILSETQTNQIKVGLIRVPEAETTLPELCSNLYKYQQSTCMETKSGTKMKNPIFPLFPKAILGRHDHIKPLPHDSFSCKIMNDNKVHLDIPHSVAGVSRNQIRVLDIASPALSTSPSTPIAHVSTPRSVDLQLLPAISETSNTTELLAYLKNIQETSPTITIQINEQAPQGVNVIKARGSNSHQSANLRKRKRRRKMVLSSSQLDDNEQLKVLKQPIQYLAPKMMAVLKVGDAIEFDAYNRSVIRRNALFGLASRSNKKGICNKEDDKGDEKEEKVGQHVFRLVAYRHHPEKMSEKVTSISESGDIAANSRTKITTPKTPESQITKNLAIKAIETTIVQRNNKNKNSVLSTFDNDSLSSESRSSSALLTASSSPPPLSIDSGEVVERRRKESVQSQEEKHLESVNKVLSYSAHDLTPEYKIRTLTSINKNSISTTNKEEISKFTNLKSETDAQQIEIRPRKIIEKPRKGDRFRVRLKQLDHFDNKYNMWFFGTLKDVKVLSEGSGKGQFSLGIKYDDSTDIEYHDYPHEDNQKLLCPEQHTSFTEEDRDSNWHSRTSDSLSEGIVFVEDSNGKKNIFACHTKPTKLVVGDLVQVHSQDGKYKDRWYHGRVAAVKDDYLFDVAYFDGDYEENIPLAEGNVNLIERGSYECSKSWLLGIAIEESDDKLVCGRILAHKNVRPGKIIGLERTSHAFQSSSPEVDMSDSTLCNIKFRNGVEQRTYNEVVGNLYKTIYDSSVKKGKVMGWPLASLCELQNDTNETSNISMESQNSCLDSSTHLSLRSKAKEMHPSLGNSLWRALNSAEPHNGYGLLMHMTSIFNAVPNSQLARNLFELILHGPKSEGTRFRDPNRTQLTAVYLDYLIGRSPDFQNFSSINLVPLKWSEFEHIISLPIVETKDKVFSRTELPSLSAIRRLGQALQMSSRSLGYISSYLKLELRELINNGLDKNENRGAYVTKRFIRSILCQHVRESLKSTVRWAIKCWINHGHWLYGHVGEGRRICRTTHHQRCASEAKLCLSSLGEIVCYLSWLYCAEEGIPFGHRDCCFLINDIVSLELENVDFGDSESNGKIFKDKTRKKFIEGIMVRFLISLDTDFALPLREGLGKMLKLSSTLSIIAGE